MGESYTPDEDEPEKYDFSLLEQFTITAVAWDCFAGMPVRFSLDDNEGNIRHWSGTVAVLNNQADYRRFEITFATENPRETHPDWSENDWNIITAREIRIGMTREMLLMSWGDPEDINRTVTKDSVSEQLVYGYQYVYVENGVVTAWQN